MWHMFQLVPTFSKHNDFSLLEIDFLDKNIKNCLVKTIKFILAVTPSLGILKMKSIISRQITYLR